MEPLDFVVKSLESKKRIAPNGEEYWMGRDIQLILGYTEWRKVGIRLTHQTPTGCGFPSVLPDCG